MANQNEQLPIRAEVNEEAMRNYMLSEYDDLPEVKVRLETNPHRVADLNVEF